LFGEKSWRNKLLGYFVGQSGNLEQSGGKGSCFDRPADPVGAMRVAGLIEIAARSPRSLVHIPLRGDSAPVGWRWLKQAGLVDLLVVQPRLQFPAHRWSEVRRRLDSGRMQSFETAGRTREQVCDQSPGCWRRTPLAMPAITREHAGTLLITASPPALRAFADCFAHLAAAGRAVSGGVRRISAKRSIRSTDFFAARSAVGSSCTATAGPLAAADELPMPEPFLLARTG